MFGNLKQKLVTDETLIGLALERRLEIAGVFPDKEEAISLLKSKSLQYISGLIPPDQIFILVTQFHFYFLNNCGYSAMHP